MPRDADFGRELVRVLEDKYTGLVKTIQFTYDAFVELDRFPSESAYCFVSPNNYTHVREGRSVFRETISLELSLVSAAGPTDNPSWIDNWLDSWDMLIRNIRSEPLFGKHLPMSVDIDQRYDSDLFHNSKRLLTQATLHYQNVEVI